MCNGAVSSEIYKCEIGGKLVFTDNPCAGEIIQLKSTNILPPMELLNNKLDSKEAYSSSKWYADYSGYKTALNVSEKLNTPIFIYFQADWCRYCRKLENELFSTTNGRKILKKIIKVKITPENGDRENRLFEKFGGRGYPTIFIQKTVDGTPKKYYLMSKESGSWETRSPSYLEQIINSQI